MPAIVSNELYRFYHRGDDETAALRGVSLTVESGEFVALMGPSGSGKSTLLACLAGLDEPDGGYVEIAGERLTHRSETQRARLRARLVGMLMQSGNLIEHLSVIDNVRLQLRLSDNGAGKDAGAVLDQLHLTDRSKALPSRLSGGEAARAGLAVALCTWPAVLICDEPTAEIDAETEVAVITALRAAARSRAAVLVATHSAALAAQADRVIRLADGKVVS